jgi:hypothetical protein
MAIPEHAYQRTTWDSLHKCLTWTLNILQLRDWRVELYAKRLDGYGEANIKTLRKIASVGIDLVECKKSNISPYSVVIHEALHIAVQCHVNDEDMDDEMIVRILEPIMYVYFCRENNKRITEEYYEL